MCGASIYDTVLRYYETRKVVSIGNVIKVNDDRGLFLIWAQICFSSFLIIPKKN